MVIFIAATCDFLGKLMVSYTAIAVHHRFRKEHRIDEKVFLEMKREQVIGIIGIGLMFAAYLLELSFVF